MTAQRQRQKPFEQRLCRDVKSSIVNIDAEFLCFKAVLSDRAVDGIKWGLALIVLKNVIQIILVNPDPYSFVRRIYKETPVRGHGFLRFRTVGGVIRPTTERKPSIG